MYMYILFFKKKKVGMSFLNMLLFTPFFGLLLDENWYYI